MALLRGRAASPVRPGIITKAVLMQKIPLVSGELVTEAAITDLHSAYKACVKRENVLRPKANKLRGMTYRSYLTLFKFAQLLNLVELVREEPMEYPPPGGNLYSIRTTGKPDGVHSVHAVISTRRVFKITPVGIEDERAWTNLCRAWIDNWPIPSKVEEPLEYVPPIEKPPVKRRPPKEVVGVPAIKFTPYEWRSEPATANFIDLARHLRTLAELGIESPGVAEEIIGLIRKLSSWYQLAEEGKEDAESIGHTSAARQLTDWMVEITNTREALLNQDMNKAVNILESMA